VAENRVFHSGASRLDIGWHTDPRCFRFDTELNPATAHSTHILSMHGWRVALAIAFGVPRAQADP
jgi:hypothetical protein